MTTKIKPKNEILTAVHKTATDFYNVVIVFSCFLKENTVSRLVQGEVCGTIESCEKVISALIPLTSRKEWITCMLYMRHSMTQADMLER